MKVQDLLFSYLNEHKRMVLPGIGLFVLTGTIKKISEEETSIPENAIEFTADKITSVEDNLLIFLKERTGKMKALAQSDLDSFINNGIQLLNIGKPFDIPGIGVIHKSSDGKISFHQGVAEPELFLTDQTKLIVQNHSNESGGTKRNSTNKTASTISPDLKRMIVTIAGILIVAVIIWVIFLQLTGDEKKEEKNPTTESSTVANESENNIQEVAADTGLLKKDTLNRSAVSGFEMVGQYPSNMDSIRKYYKLYNGRGHKVRIDTSEATNPRLLFTFKKPLKDTSFVSDSMRIWYRIRMRYFAPLNQ